MRPSTLWLALPGLLLLAACAGTKSACPTPVGTPAYLSGPPAALAPQNSGLQAAPVSLEIGGRMVPIDQVISGPLCNDHWKGTIYVTCDVQVYPWVEQPTFLKDCQLEVEPGTVVYVAYHNDTPYYNGCSCHTGEIDAP